MLEIEEGLSSLFKNMDEGLLSQELLEELNLLKRRWDNWLKIEEIEWRLKSCALWLKAGDNNTHFFHQYGNFIWNYNTTWDIKSEEGETISFFQGKVDEGVRYFEKIFEALVGCPIQEILAVVSKFPRIFTEYMNQSLQMEVLEVEMR